MKRSLTISLTGILLLVSQALSVAAEEGSRVMELRTARTKIARAAERTKGTAHHRFRLQERALTRLIDELESGRGVTSADVDRALARAADGI